MKWLNKLFSRRQQTPLESNPAVDELIWNHRVNLPTYDYANRHFEPQWMLKIRQEDLVKHQIIQIIDETPESDLLSTNYNNETLLSLLIEKDEAYLPVIKALVTKYPHSYDQQFKVKNLKSYIEYCLEKHNLPAYEYLLSRDNSLRLHESQYDNYINQIMRFSKGNENILTEGLDKLDNLKDIPWDTMKSLFITKDNYGATKYVFGKAQKKALILLLNKDYFGDKLSSYTEFFFNLFNNSTMTITGEDEDSAELILRLHQLGVIHSVNFVEETLCHHLSLFKGQLYVSKFSKSLQELGIGNKSLVKEVYSKIFLPEGVIVRINESLIKCLLKLNSIDPQILVPLVTEWESGQLSDIIKYNTQTRDWTIESLIKVYSPRRIVQLFINEIKNPSVKEHEFSDTFIQSGTLFNLCTEFGLDPKEYFPKKPQSLHQIHETVWREMSKLKSQNIKLHSYYPPSLMKLNGQTVGGYTIKIPEDSHLLVDVGTSMLICVGGGHYRDRIMQKESFIVLLMHQGKVEYCIEVHNNSTIIQFKGYSNKDASNSSLYHLFKSLITP